MKPNDQPPQAASPQPELKAQVISNPFAEAQPTDAAQPSSGVAQAVPVQVASAAPQPQTAPSAPQPEAPSVQSPAAPPAAADNDLIEKEWVDAIEQHIHSYSDDPFVLQQQLAALSRDYLKKRFNLDIEASQ